MEIVVRYSAGCPSRDLALSRVREALGGRDVQVTLEQVDALDEADFQGSPTIVVDGRDPFAGPEGRAALSCRLYRTEDGLEGAPSVDQLREALG